MKTLLQRLPLSLLSALLLAMLIAEASPAMALSLLRCPDLALFIEQESPGISIAEMMARLRTVEEASASSWSSLEKAACYKELADDHRDAGGYAAEPLYLRAVELAPDHPVVLADAALYFRTFRGSQSLFPESENLYLRSEQAIDELITAECPPPSVCDPDLLQLREAIIRGRIALHVPEGLGIVIPRRLGQKIGAYLRARIGYGELPTRLNSTLADRRNYRTKLQPFDPHDLLRESSGFDQRYQLRVRYGDYPHIGVGWQGAYTEGVIAEDWDPGQFKDFELSQFELALGDTVGRAPVGDLFWRLQYQRGRTDVRGATYDTRERFDRVSGSATLTRSFGRAKTDLELLTSFASIAPPGDVPRDDDWTFGANVRLLHYPESSLIKNRTIELRGYEFIAGFVQHRREYRGFCKSTGPVASDLVENTVFAGFKLPEVLPRTDIQFLPNFFRTTVKGKECVFDAEADLNATTSDLEANVTVTHRVLDFVNDLTKQQADRSVGLAQWSASLRLFADIATEGPNDFNSSGFVLSSFIELFSGPQLNTVILEGTYELRAHYEIDQVQHLFRMQVRTGF